MQTRFMGISHGSSRQHVTVWSIFGNGRYPGAEPKVVHSGPGCMPGPLQTSFLKAQKTKEIKDWMFKIRRKSEKEYQRGGALFSPLFRRSAGVELKQVCHAMENTHNMQVMWLDLRSLILHSWSDVYSLFPSGSAHWSLRPPLKEEAA